MKRHSILTLMLIALVCVSCFPTRIVTVSPSTVGPVYSTTVTVPRTHTVTTTTQVRAFDQDICLHLDLQAVAAVFAQSSSVREFESLLNNSSYIISNLDLNRDGYVDYLRVLETLDHYTHVFLIQAVLGANVYQDVATLVVENPGYSTYHVEVIGAPFIYGPKYIIRPIYMDRPYIFAHLCRRDYKPWRSPWHWDYFPSYYKRPVPVYLNHYQAYVSTFMHNHHYCHEVTYPHSYHYSNYEYVSREFQRNDYGKMHPEQSFSVRNADMPSSSNSAVMRAERALNARDLREAHDASKNTTVVKTNSRPQASQAPASVTGRGSATTATVSGSSTTGRGSSASSSSSSSSARTTTQPEQSTTVRSRVNQSGTSDTSIRTRTSNGTESTVRRSSSTTGSNSSTRSSAGSSSSNNSSTRSSATSSSSRSGSTATTSGRSSGTGAASSSSRSGSGSTGSRRGN